MTTFELKPKEMVLITHPKRSLIYTADTKQWTMIVQTLERLTVELSLEAGGTTNF